MGERNNVKTYILLLFYSYISLCFNFYFAKKKKATTERVKAKNIIVATRMTITSDCRECMQCARSLSSCSLRRKEGEEGNRNARRDGANGGRCKREEAFTFNGFAQGPTGIFGAFENTYGEVTKFRNERQPYV